MVLPGAYMLQMTNCCAASALDMWTGNLDLSYRCKQQNTTDSYDLPHDFASNVHPSPLDASDLGESCICTKHQAWQGMQGANIYNNTNGSYETHLLHQHPHWLEPPHQLPHWLAH